MTKYIIWQDQSAALQIGDGDTVVIEPGVMIVDPSIDAPTREPPDWSGIQDDRGGNNDLRIFGTVEGFIGTWLWAGSNTETVGAGGDVFGFNAGAEFHDGGHDLLRVEAGGEVASTLYAVWFGNYPRHDYREIPDSGFDTVVNAGLIEGGLREGIRMVLGGNSVVNSGTIMSNTYPAIFVQSAASDPRNLVTNNGHIAGGLLGEAIVSGDAPMSVLNNGSITGDVQFGAGADRFTGTGTVTGTIYGGDGNDRLEGGAGRTTFCGGAGADYLKAASGASTFLYGAASDSTMGGGVDTIDRFDFKWDHIVVAGTAVASFDHIDALRELQPGHAALMQSASGTWFMVVDANGTAGYQPGADIMIALTHPLHMDV